MNTSSNSCIAIKSRAAIPEEECRAAIIIKSK